MKDSRQLFVVFEHVVGFHSTIETNKQEYFKFS